MIIQEQKKLQLKKIKKKSDIKNIDVKYNCEIIN